MRICGGRAAWFCVDAPKILGGTQIDLAGHLGEGNRQWRQLAGPAENALTKGLGGRCRAVC